MRRNLGQEGFMVALITSEEECTTGKALSIPVIEEVECLVTHLVMEEEICICVVVQ